MADPEIRTFEDAIKKVLLDLLARGHRPEDTKKTLGANYPDNLKKFVAPSKVPSARESKALKMYADGVEFWAMAEVLNCQVSTAQATISICRNVKKLPVPHRMPSRVRK